MENVNVYACSSIGVDCGVWKGLNIIVYVADRLPMQDKQATKQD